MKKKDKDFAKTVLGAIDMMNEVEFFEWFKNVQKYQAKKTAKEIHEKLFALNEGVPHFNKKLYLLFERSKWNKFWKGLK